MKILTSKEAFEALMAGRNVMCRAIGELIEFNDLDQFPATTFAMPGYEFCIKVETMELAGITFTKPLTLDDVMEGQEIFLVYPNCIAHTQFTSLSGKYVECVRYGFAQADQENAELQLQAIGKLLGRAIPYPLTIESHYKPEKKRRNRKAKEDTGQASTPTDPVNTLQNIEKQSEPEVIQPVEVAPEAPSAITEIPVVESEEPAIETNPVKLVEKFTAQIDQFTKTDDVLSFRHVFLANGYLDQKDQQHLCKLTEDKLLELDPEQYTPQVEETTQPGNPQPGLIDEIEQAARKQASAESVERGSSAPIDLFYNKKKEVLIKRIHAMDSIDALERLAPAIPAAKLLLEDHQELLSIYAQHKEALQSARVPGEAS